MPDNDEGQPEIVDLDKAMFKKKERSPMRLDRFSTEKDLKENGDDVNRFKESQ
jgi:hypothetical protein